MRNTALVTVFSTILISPGSVVGGTVEDELAAIKARLQQLEQRVQVQNELIQKKDRQIQELIKNPHVPDTPEEGKANEGEDSWIKNVDIGGVVEVEASYQDPFEGDSTSDVVLATAELAIAAQLNDWIASKITFLYEEDETDLEVDVAAISVVDPDGPWFVTAGQQYVPFGTYETHLVSDPLTLEIGETRETAVLGGFEAKGLRAAAYLFNGDNKENGDDKIDNFGAIIGYAQDGEFAVNIGYINDIGDSDNLQDVIANNLGNNNVANHVPGYTADAQFTAGPFFLIGEYTAALDEFEATEVPFDGRGAKPKAFNVEAGYGFSIAGKETTFAIAYQGTEEALALELPQRRVAAALSMGILKNTALSFEWAHDDDYDESEGGTGNSAHTATAQLAVEF